MAVTARRAFDRAAVRTLRERALLSQEELAERSGLSVRTVRNLEAGRVTQPHPRTMQKICEALATSGVPYSDLDGRSPFRDVVPHQLPADIADFTGRRDEIEKACRVLHPGYASRIAAVDGLAGLGKTTLAVHIAHRVSARFPDGQLYADLRGVQPVSRPPGDVLAQFLQALGIDETAIPDGLDERSALYRSLLDGKRILVLLDNAADEAQVRPLLASGDGCASLLTSRRHLAGLTGVHTVTPEMLSGHEAVTLLGRIVGHERIAGRPGAERVVSACGGLPLAIRIAGARLAARPHWTTATLATLLDDERERLDELSTGDLDVRAGFALSYRLLDDDHRQAFRLLGRLDTAEFSAAALADQVTRPAGRSDRNARAALRQASRTLEDLVDARLVQIAGISASGQARYRLHELLRLFAQEVSQTGTAIGVARRA